jgi:hypothetical protein
MGLGVREMRGWGDGEKIINKSNLLTPISYLLTPIS